MSRNELLDSILEELSNGDTLYMRNSSDIQKSMSIEFLNDSFKLYMGELIRLNYVESNEYVPNPSYRITFQGLSFLERGGFVEFQKSLRSRKQHSQRSKLLLTISTISVMVLTTISTVSQCRDSQKYKDSIDKELKTLKLQLDSLKNNKK